DRVVGVIIAMDTAIRDDVETHVLLVDGDGPNRILERFATHGIRRLSVAMEMARPPCVPPPRVRVVADHTRRNQDVLPTYFHAAPPSCFLRADGDILWSDFC